MFDFKKEMKELYAAKAKPALVDVAAANFIAISGKGDPNEEDGAYRKAIGVLYSVAYTLKMSYKGTYKIDGFFEYVVPPLEGFWSQDGVDGVDYSDKTSFRWTSAIRLPDFIEQKHFDWAVAEASQKKKLDCSGVELLRIDEGVCAQATHIGSYDDEQKTVVKIKEFVAQIDFELDFSDSRRHHEIYLSDPRKTSLEKLKTILRLPIKKAK